VIVARSQGADIAGITARDCDAGSFLQAFYNIFGRDEAAVGCRSADVILHFVDHSEAVAAVLPWLPKE